MDQLTVKIKVFISVLHLYNAFAWAVAILFLLKLIYVLFHFRLRY